MIEHPWDFQVDIDDAAFLTLDFNPGLTEFIAEACRAAAASAASSAPVSLTAVATPSDQEALVTVHIDRVAAMGVKPEATVNWAIESNGIAPEWAIRDGVLDLLLHISQPAVRAGDLFLVEITTTDADGHTTSNEQRLVLVRGSEVGLLAQLSYRPRAAEVVIAKVLAGPLAIDQLTNEQAGLIQASVEESLGPNTLAWYERLASGPEPRDRD